ncbi:MAG: aldehyde dehydrogenase family protein, partial [Chloroflexi bacterium]|nr:aldehyde dehydrogenase family protein [Chloroflexota bacterium]
MTQVADVTTRDKLFIGGQWVDSAGSKMIDVVNPATEEVIGRVPEGTPEDVDKAVAAAKAAFETWSQTTKEERATYLQAIAGQLATRQEEIATTISSEVGMPFKLSRMIQAGLPLMTFSSMPGILASTEFEEQVGSSLV